MKISREKNQEDEAKTLHNMARIDLNRRDYEKARQKFEKSLKIDQQICDLRGEAANWHNLGTIDVELGEYEEARQKFEKSLKIKQQIGDRSGEGATFAQLGIMAAVCNRIEYGLRLVSLSAMIFGSIGHVNLKQVEPYVKDMICKLNYTQEQFDAMLQEVAESYQRDRGRGLIEAAFANLTPEPDKV